MKNNNLLIFTFLSMALLVSCTDDFNEINERPDALTSADVSAKYFVTNTQMCFGHDGLLVNPLRMQ